MRYCVIYVKYYKSVDTKLCIYRFIKIYERTWQKQPWLSLGRFCMAEEESKGVHLLSVLLKTTCHIIDIEYTEHI